MRLRDVSPLLAIAVAACAPALAPTQPTAPAQGAPGASTSPPAAEPPAAATFTPCPAAPSAAVSDESADDARGALDDGFEPPPATDANAASPLDAISDAELEAKLEADPSSLGSISIGGGHAGALLFGVQLQPSAHWEVVSPVHAWGARETVEQLARAIDRVNAEIPGTPKLYIGDLSAKNGGHLPPHISHQSGRDVDVGYYYTADALSQARWYAPATEKNLDSPRTWALVKALIEVTDVEFILMDTRVQRLLKDYALSAGEDSAWLDTIFQVGGKSRRPLIFYAPGHGTHLHVRFYAPESRELGRRAYAILVKKKLLKPATYFVDHTVKPGETIGTIAARYKTSVEAIKRANRMASNVVVKGKAIKVPQVGGVDRPAAKIVAPPRRLPPAKSVAAGAPPPVESPSPCKPTG